MEFCRENSINIIKVYSYKKIKKKFNLKFLNYWVRNKYLKLYYFKIYKL